MKQDLLGNMLASSPAGAADDDLSLARASGTNVLLIGHDPDVSSAATYLADSAGSSTSTIWAARGLRLPRQAASDVVIAHDIDGLLPDEQQALLGWLRSAGGDTRVISTASPALWPMVRDGAFNPELYYRLNTVCVRVS